MSVKLVLPRPSEKYDPREEAQRNQLIEQAFGRTSSGGANATLSTGTGGVWDLGLRLEGGIFDGGSRV